MNTKIKKEKKKGEILAKDLYGDEYKDQERENERRNIG